MNSIGFRINAGALTSFVQLRLLDDYLTSALVAVRTRRNQDDAVTNKFPPEILATIFDHVRYGTMDTRASDNKKAALDVRSLITVTHVCRSWRTLALDTASLWTHVAAYSSSTPAFVERARGARIDEVSAAVLNGQLSKAQKNVLWQFRPHLRVLHLTADSIKQLAVFRKLLREVAGSLETLTIGVRNASRRQADMDSHIVPCSLFGGRARSLKSLTISSGYALVPTDRFPALLHLHLSGFWHGQLFNHLPLLFRNASALMTFALHIECDSRRTRMGEADWGSGPIALPSMRHFCIMSLPPPSFQSGHETLIPGILSNLVLPPEVTVAIKQSNMPRPFRLFAHRMFVPQGGHNLATSLTMEDDTTIATTREDSTTYSIIYAGRITPRYHGIFDTPPHFHAHAFSGSEALLKTVQRLRIQSTFYWSHPRDVLSCLTGHTPFLTELVLRDFGRRDLLMNLSAMLEHPNVILCPNLTSVVYISLSKHSGIGASAADILFRATARRAQRGYPLKRVTYCSPYTAQEYTLQNAHGVETVSVLRRDVWAEYDDADKESREHLRAVQRARSEQHRPRKTCDYGALWQRCLEDELPVSKRGYGRYGHQHRWP